VKGFEHGANSQKLKVEGSRLRVEIERIKVYGHELGAAEGG